MAIILLQPSMVIGQEGEGAPDQGASGLESKSSGQPKGPKKTNKKGKTKSDLPQKKSKKVTPNEEGEEPPPREESEDNAKSKAKDSAANSKFKKIGVGLNGGFAYLGGGGGVEGWFSPSRRLDLGLRFVGASSKMVATGDAALLETADVTMVQIATTTRFYLFKSFYLLGGLGYNTFSGQYGVTINQTKQEYLLPMKASGLSLNVAIGNMWKWDSGFVLGFDWVGYSSFTGMSVKLGDPDSPEEKEVFEAFRVIPGGGDPEAKAKSLLTRNNLYAFLMTLGFAF